MKEHNSRIVQVSWRIESHRLHVRAGLACARQRLQGVALLLCSLASRLGRLGLEGQTSRIAIRYQHRFGLVIQSSRAIQRHHQSSQVDVDPKHGNVNIIQKEGFEKKKHTCSIISCSLICRCRSLSSCICLSSMRRRAISSFFSANRRCSSAEMRRAAWSVERRRATKKPTNVELFFLLRENYISCEKEQLLHKRYHTHFA